MTKEKYKTEIRIMWLAYNTKQYLYGYVECLENYGLINLDIFEELNNDIFRFKR